MTALVEERLLAVERSRRAKRHSLTDQGREALGQRRRELAALEERTGLRFTEADSLVPHIEEFAARMRKISGKVDVKAAAEILQRAGDEIERLEDIDAEGD